MRLRSFTPMQLVLAGVLGLVLLALLVLGLLVEDRVETGGGGRQAPRPSREQAPAGPSSVP